MIKYSLNIYAASKSDLLEALAHAKRSITAVPARAGMFRNGHLGGMVQNYRGDFSWEGKEEVLDRPKRPTKADYRRLAFAAGRDADHPLARRNQWHARDKVFATFMRQLVNENTRYFRGTRAIAFIDAKASEKLKTQWADLSEVLGESAASAVRAWLKSPWALDCPLEDVSP